jgi:signal transduction histidine kinase
MIDGSRKWNGDRVINVLIALILAGVVLRSLGTLFPSEDPLRWVAVGLMAVFTLLLGLSFWPAVNSRFNYPLYFIVQSSLTLTLLLLPPFLDFYGVFFGILSVQAIRVFPQESAFKWIAGFALVTGVALIWGLGWSDGLPLVVLYAALFFALAYFVVLKDRAENAQRESQSLLEELSKAHEQLQEHAAQIEELAIMKERNRLARDLHDSVTQSLYSLTLFTQAARERASAGDLAQSERSLARIADTAGQALKEMRLLVYELRPPTLEERGLVEALEQRLDMVERRSGVRTRLIIEAEEDFRLPEYVEDELYHIGQEALNNALKHAQATSLTVRLAKAQESQRVELEVSDDGRGFDIDATKGNAGLGLMSIGERVENLRGVLELTSAPGKGTSVLVCLEVAP